MFVSYLLENSLINFTYTRRFRVVKIFIHRCEDGNEIRSDFEGNVYLKENFSVYIALNSEFRESKLMNRIESVLKSSNSKHFFNEINSKPVFYKLRFQTQTSISISNHIRIRIEKSGTSSRTLSYLKSAVRAPNFPAGNEKAEHDRAKVDRKFSIIIHGLCK